MTHNEINACYTYLTARADAVEPERVGVASAEYLLMNEFRCDPIMVWGIALTWHATRYDIVLPPTTPNDWNGEGFKYTAPARVPFSAEFPIEKNAPMMNFSVYNPNELR